MFQSELFNAGAVFVGFVSHLLLDEMWSVEMAHGLLHLKKSFGSTQTVEEMIPGRIYRTYAASCFCYTVLITKDPAWDESIEPWLNGRPSLADLRNNVKQHFNDYRQRYLQGS